MSRVQFDALRRELEAQRWNLLDIAEETALGTHYVQMLRNAALWARRYGQVTRWFETDYAALARPDLSPPDEEIGHTLAVCRENGELSRFGPRCRDLLLRWAWAQGEIDMDGLPAPYEPLLPIFRAGAGIHGEHGNFRGPGLGSIYVGLPAHHLQDASERVWRSGGCGRH